MREDIFYGGKGRRKRKYSKGELANIRRILLFAGKVCVCGMLFGLVLIGVYRLACGWPGP